MASYPLTVLNQARLDGLIRNGGKALRAEASQTERQVSAILTRIFSGEVSSTDDLWDPVNWTVRGFGDGDVVPTKLWSRARQAALVAADDKARGDGAIRVALGEALRESMVRAQVVVDLATINPGQSSAEVTMQIARQSLRTSSSERTWGGSSPTMRMTSPASGSAPRTWPERRSTPCRQRSLSAGTPTACCRGSRP